MTSTPTERPQLPRALRRDSLWTFGLLGVSAFAWALGLPTSLLVILSGPATIAFAISALINTRGVETAAGIRVWLAVAMAMGSMIMVAGFGLLIMRGPTEQLERCLDRAITESAKRECQADYDKAYEDLLKRYGGARS